MRFNVQCPACDHITRLPATAFGTHHICLNCGAKMSVPALHSTDDDIPFAEVVEENLEEVGDTSSPPADRLGGGHDTENRATNPTIAADGTRENPYRSPRTTSHETNDSGAEAIDFAPDISDIPDVPSFENPRQKVALAFSGRQLRDALRSASTTRSAANFVFAMLLISLAIEGFLVIVTGIAIAQGVPAGANNEALIALGIHFVGGIISGLFAALTWDYSLRLGEFCKHKRAEDLVESLASACRYWQTSAVVTGLLFGVTVFAILAVVAMR